MPQYVLINRRSGLFTETAKVASRASVATTLNMLTNASGQVRALLDNFDGDALGIWRTAGRVRSVWARSSSSRIARN